MVAMFHVKRATVSINDNGRPVEDEDEDEQEQEDEGGRPLCIGISWALRLNLLDATASRTGC
jgi:hypothetical protein